MVDSMHLRQQMRQQQAHLATIPPAASARRAQYCTTTMIVRMMASNSEPKAIEPKEKVQARSRPHQTGGLQPKQPLPGQG
tara:strand:+ start:467 stop:706 length:240 start_codon:yes stop_codon:yes gene_type:complete